MRETTSILDLRIDGAPERSDRDHRNANVEDKLTESEQVVVLSMCSGGDQLHKCAIDAAGERTVRNETPKKLTDSVRESLTAISAFVKLSSGSKFLSRLGNFLFTLTFGTVQARGGMAQV